MRKRIQADIKRKVEGQEIAVTAPEPEPARIIDLMEALKASLGKSKGAAPADQPRAASAAASAAARGSQAGPPFRARPRPSRKRKRPSADPPL